MSAASGARADRIPSRAMTTPVRTLHVTLLALGLVACGGSASSAETTTTASADGTSGSERPHPIRTTTPIPVPTPAIERDALSAQLQRVWELVEAAIAVRPPEPPSEPTTEHVQEWANGPFAEWIGRRITATREAEEALVPLEEAPAYERGLAAGLIGYLHEDTAADVRGAPIPDEIANDAELLAIYTSALDDALRPAAEAAFRAYTFCTANFDEVGDSTWVEWRTYCEDRRQDVSTVFRVGPNAPAAASTGTSG